MDALLLAVTGVRLATEEGPAGVDLFIPALYDILWSALVLIPIMWVVYKKVVPNMTVMLDARTAKIEGGIEHAERVQAEADAAKVEYERKLAEARADMARQRELARAEGEKIIAEMRQKANEDAARIVDEAERQIAAERAAAEQALKADLGTLATELAGKLVGEQLSDAAAQSRVIDRFLDELEQGVARSEA
jgi:F-type H+-transporting ATPase subunit b